MSQTTPVELTYDELVLLRSRLNHQPVPGVSMGAIDSVLDARLFEAQRRLRP